MAVDREYAPKGLGWERVALLRQELLDAGVHLVVDGGAGCGVSKTIDAQIVAAPGGAAMQAQQQVFDVLVRGRSLSITLRNLGSGQRAVATMAAACDVLLAAVQDAGASADQLELVVDSRSLSPCEAALVRQRHLGHGVVHALTGPETLRTRHCEDGKAAAFWQQLWHSPVNRVVRIAYASQVMTPCPLLSHETATAVLPVTHIQVPPGTAWLQMRLDVSRFSDRRGTLFDSALEQALQTCVDVGDRLLDELDWPTAEMRDDAWASRRLAIIVEGLGDLLLRRRLDPAMFASLEFLNRLLQRARAVVHARSRRRAFSTRMLPLLEHNNPGRALPCGALRDDWHARWVAAVDAAMTRHRNFLVMSPWSVFPSGRDADFRYIDLLPVLRFADACLLSNPPGLSTWNVNKFRLFHRRAFAALQQREVAHQIAE